MLGVLLLVLVLVGLVAADYCGLIARLLECVFMLFIACVCCLCWVVNSVVLFLFFLLFLDMLWVVVLFGCLLIAGYLLLVLFTVVVVCVSGVLIDCCWCLTCCCFGLYCGIPSGWFCGLVC